MEIVSDELITEAEKERIRKVLNELCHQAFVSAIDDEAATTARTVFYDAVSSAAKQVADGISAEAVPIARDIVTSMLRDASQHPYLETAVLEAVQPIARAGAYAAIRRWSEEKAKPKAQEAAHKVFAEIVENGCPPVLNTAVLASARAILENEYSNHPQLSAEDGQKIVDEYLAGEANVAAKTAAAELVSKAISADLRRRAQRAAELAVEEVASQANDAVARDEGLDAARVVATDTAKLEISRLVLAEAQRRSAKLARERLQEEAPAQSDDKKAEYCQSVARKVADDAVNSVVEEIADPSVADLDLDKARELALSAASAVAREFSGAYQLTPEDDSVRVSSKTLMFLGMQIFTGCFIVWFFLLGGYETCEPFCRAVLPPQLYFSIYSAVPYHAPTKAPGTKTGTEVDDLLDDQQKPGTGKEPADEVPTVKPAETSDPNLRKNPGTEQAPPSSSSGTVSPAQSTGSAATAPPSKSPSSSATATPAPSSSSTTPAPPVKSPSSSETASPTKSSSSSVTASPDGSAAPKLQPASPPAADSQSTTAK